MDIANINEIATNFVKYGQLIPVAAGAFAGLSAMSLLAGVRRVHKKDISAGFPTDPDAAQPKYLFAFDQLVESQNSDLGTSTRVVPDPTRPAMNLCIDAFAKYTVMRRPEEKPKPPVQPADKKPKQ